MNFPTVRASRAWEGSAAGLIVGLFAGITVTGSTITAEVGQILWLLSVLTGAVVISGVERPGLRTTALACLPFAIGVLGVLLWTGAATTAWAVTKAVLVARASIPVAAFTEREMIFRYGLFFLFVLTASLPAVLGVTIAWQDLKGVAGRLAARTRYGTLVPSWAAVVSERLVRIAICLGMVAVSRLA